MGYIKQQVNILSLKLMCWKQKTMGNCKDLKDFDKGQIVIARQLVQRNSKTAALVRCSCSAVVKTYQIWSKKLAMGGLLI